MAVAGAVSLLEQGRTHAGNDLPIASEVVNIAFRDAAAQVAVNVLEVLRLGAVNVAGEVEVIVVLPVGDFFNRHHAGVARDIDLLEEGVHDLVDVLLTQAVFVAVLDEALGSVSLLAHVGVAELNLEGVAQQLKVAGNHRGRAQTWLKCHNDEWLQGFYQLLNGIKDYYQVTALGALPIVRTSEGKHMSAPQVRFAPAEERKDLEVEIEGVCLVAASVLNGKKQIREEVEQFLRRLGVGDVNEQDYIRALLAKHYRPGSTVPDMKAHLRHVERYRISGKRGEPSRVRQSAR
jgi:5-hydroxyisourate hydrolase-like protein (transthyretin family)